MIYSGKNCCRKARLEVCSLLMCIGAILVCSSVALAQSDKSNEISKLKQLCDQKKYFELRDAVESYRGKRDARLLFFRGALANSFNEPRVSMKYLNQYIARAVADDEWLSDAYTMLADDFVKMYDYGRASDTYRTILDRFKQRLKPDEIEDYENSATFYGSLREVPRQRVTLGQAARLNEPSSEAGWNVRFEANNQRVSLGLDTGANVSLLAKSVAERLGVKMLNKSISVGSITSIKVQPKLGLLPTMKIGNATIHNAVFIILDDEALTFPDGFVLKGVIGFPIIAGLRKISFNGDGTVSGSGRSSGRGRPSMSLDGRNILFQGEYENKRLTFMLDTGAERSVLYAPFLHDFEDEIRSKYSQRTEKFTGVGGTEEVPAYIVKDFAVSFDGKSVRLPEIRLLTKVLNDNSKFYYGNVGQDLIKRFHRMTLDFDSMRIAFE